MIRKEILFLGPFILFLALIVYFAQGLQRDPSAIPSALINKPVPTFELATIKGDAVGLSSEMLRGEVSLVNIFGSWCAGCLIEHPILMNEVRASKVPLYGLDWKDPPARAQAWLARHGDPYTAIGADFNGRTALKFGVTGAPETFIIDKKGRIRYKHVGPITAQNWAQDLLPLIEDLQDE